MGHYKVAGNPRSSANFQVVNQRKHLSIRYNRQRQDGRYTQASSNTAPVVSMMIAVSLRLSEMPLNRSMLAFLQVLRRGFCRRETLEGVPILRPLDCFRLTLRHDRRVIAAIRHRDLEQRAKARLAFDLHIAAQQIDELPH